MNTIYTPTYCSPSVTDNNGGTVDMSQDTDFSMTVNGSQIDSYLLQIKDLNSNLLYNTGGSTEILNSNVGITYGGTWNNSTNQIIDDTNSNISYYGYGWNARNFANLGYYNNTVHQSSTMSDGLQMDFIGTGIKCYFTTGVDMGIFEVFIDGVSKGTFDNYSSGNYKFQQLQYSITDLILSSHTIKIQVTGSKNVSSSGIKVEIDYFEVLNTNGAKNSNTKGNYFSYMFTNTGVNVYMDKTPDSGIVDVLIDGVSQGTVDLYSNSYVINTLVYSNFNLSDESHTIQVTITGDKNTQSKNSYCYFDKLNTLSKTVLAEKIYDKQTLSITIPANTITYKGQMKWQITYWNSDNNGESVSSGEFVFFNMTTPVIGINVGDTVTSKQFEFDGSYVQDENVNIRKWNMTLYSQNYKVQCGFLGQTINGTNLDCGDIEDIPNRYWIDCGEL